MDVTTSIFDLVLMLLRDRLTRIDTESRQTKWAGGVNRRDNPDISAPAPAGGLPRDLA